MASPDPSLYWSDNYVVLDFETTTKTKGSPLDPANRIVLACWSAPEPSPRRAHILHEFDETTDVSTSNHRMRHCFGGEFDMGELVEAINGADFVVAHNAKFELGWLKRCGVDLRKIVTFDTMIGEYVLGGNKYMLQMLSLNECLKRRVYAPKEDTISRMFKAGYCSTEMPESWLLRYCERDVTATHELFLSIRQELKDKNLEAINYQRNLVTPCLADLEFNGLQLDKEKVHELVDTMEEEYAKKTAELQEFCEGASPASPTQLRGFIFEVLKFKVPTDHRGNPMLTDSGNPSTAAPALAKLRPSNKKQEEFLSLHREWGALHSDVTKYLRKFRDCCEEAGGRILGSFNQCNTRTHRLSSSGLWYKVQFQNLNRRFKPLFCARNDDWVVGEADGAQLEFRVAAHLGRDGVALRDIVEGTDIHSFTAKIIGCSRQDAKPHTFKPLYGGVSGTPAERAYYAAFAEKYNQIATTQRGWTNIVAEKKHLVTEWGMRYYWPDCKMQRSGYITHTTSIYNYPVQAFATAEIIPVALVCAWHRMKNWQSFLVNTVHDSIIAELHPEETKAWHELSKQCLIEDSYKIISALYGTRFTVPLGAGVMIGKNWADQQAKESETVYNAPEELWKKNAIAEGMIDG